MAKKYYQVTLTVTVEENDLIESELDVEGWIWNQLHEENEYMELNAINATEHVNLKKEAGYE